MIERCCSRRIQRASSECVRSCQGRHCPKHAFEIQGVLSCLTSTRSVQPGPISPEQELRSERDECRGYACLSSGASTMSLMRCSWYGHQFPRLARQEQLVLRYFVGSLLAHYDGKFHHRHCILMKRPGGLSRFWRLERVEVTKHCPSHDVTTYFSFVRFSLRHPVDRENIEPHSLGCFCAHLPHLHRARTP